MLSRADGGRKKASPTPKNRIGSAELCYCTCCTWVGVTHPITNQAKHCLTSVIEWELVFQCGYGRRALHGKLIFLQIVLTFFFENLHSKLVNLAMKIGRICKLATTYISNHVPQLGSVTDKKIALQNGGQLFWSFILRGLISMHVLNLPIQ